MTCVTLRKCSTSPDRRGTSVRVCAPVGEPVSFERAMVWALEGLPMRILAATAVAALLLAACSNPVDSSGADAATGPRPDTGTVPGQDGSASQGGDASTLPASDAALVPGADAAEPGLDAAAPGPDAASGPDRATACTAASDSICEQLEACSPFGLAALYGDLATCKARVMLGCMPVYDAPGTSSTPARTEKCALALAQLSCDAVKAGDLGPDCAAVAGTLADGAACGDDSQCQSHFCARASDALCGTCSPKSTEGGACVNGACSAGLVCPKGSSTCIKPVAGKAGDACTYQEQCDLANGVACDTTSSKKCMQIAVAEDTGDSCGITMAGFVICPASGTCSALFGGTCSAAAADGDACSDSDTGPKCLLPAKCAGGTCALPDPVTCQ
ncbi:MAG: hypothetical protein HY901_24995 [Deltaproteobacteria bacterium]|nr:hypothetical protein [Deltaproteobacteria bacterium]